jgi:hypothetical protein
VPSQQDLLRYAERCRRIVADGDIAGHRGALDEMARAWQHLAAEEQRIADFAQAVDGLLSRRVMSPNLCGAAGPTGLADQLVCGSRLTSRPSVAA